MSDTYFHPLADPAIANAVRDAPGHLRPGIALLLGPWPQTADGERLKAQAVQLAELLHDAAAAIEVALAMGDRVALRDALDGVTDAGQVAFDVISRIAAAR